jgi:hypothetical protein
MSDFASSYLCQELVSAIGQKLKPNAVWNGKDSDQKALLERSFSIDMAELDSCVQEGGTDLVKVFLHKKGMHLDLPDEIGADAICAAVVLIICSRWAFPGTEIDILKGDKKYDGAKLVASIFKTSDNHIYSPIMLDNGDYVIFEQKTKDGSSPKEKELNGKMFASLIGKNPYSGDNTNLCDEYNGGLIFPQVDLEVSRDIAEIIGAYTSNPDYTLAIAKGQCKLQMNHLGAKLKIAMGGVAMSTSFKVETPWIIDDTFCVHFVREGEVYASVLVTPEHFHKVEINFD